MGGTFASFARTDVPAGETVTFTLEGEAEPVVMPGAGGTSATTAPVARDRTTEMVIGAGVLLLALAVGFVFIRNWRQGQHEYAEPEMAGELAGRDSLLDEIAALDDAYEAGEVDEATYQRERAALKEALLEVWD
jgi:hypothetical protein